MIFSDLTNKTLKSIRLIMDWVVSVYALHVSKLVDP